MPNASEILAHVIAYINRCNGETFVTGSLHDEANGLLDECRPILEQRAAYDETRNGTTHWDGCWRHPKHHDCAVRRVEKLENKIQEMDRPANEHI